MLYPWESRSWLQANINKVQSKKLIEIYGHNPANVTEVDTAIDIETYRSISKRKLMGVFEQLFDIFSEGKKHITPRKADEVISKKLISGG